MSSTSKGKENMVLRPPKPQGINFDDKPLWNHVKVIHIPSSGGGNRVWTCNYCNRKVTGSYSKVKAHLLKIPNHGVEICKSITNDVIEMIKREYQQAESKKEKDQLHARKQADYLNLPERSDILQHKKRKPGPLEKAFNVAEQDIADGWTDIQRRPLIMAASKGGAMFVASTNASGHTKDAEYVANVFIFTRPIVDFIQAADTDSLMLHLVYDMWDTMIENVKIIVFQHEEKDILTRQSDFFDAIHSILEARWNKSNTPLHCLAHSLVPKYYSASWLQGGDNFDIDGDVNKLANLSINEPELESMIFGNDAENLETNDE
ncbi:hypothetical protein ACH5RR_007248 [Cinchona calisaya]|uniref:BED-type domain-containing protein n=1 Tax=Cinchona calisaya TaxID=153742 RepID=A0ABD3ARR0_9GENT